MTVIEFPPPATSSPVTSPVRPPRVSRLGRSSRWRLAARLARREVRRRPGRTILVMLLIAVPVMAMTIGDIAVRTNHQTWAERFRADQGAADLVVRTYTTEPSDLAITYPPGSRSVRYHTNYVPIRPADPTRERTYVQLTDLPLADPLAQGIYDLIDGRAAAAADQAVLTPTLAKDFGVGVGDVLQLASPKTSYHVVGIAQLTGKRDRSARTLIVESFDWPRLSRWSPSDVHTLVDLPPNVIPSQFADRVMRDRSVTADGVDAPATINRNQLDNGLTSQLGWGWVGGVLALTVLGIIVAAAFASSARRQLVTIGQLSSNGADPRTIRSTLALQGAWSGLAGSLFGVSLALVGLAAVGGRLLDRLANRDVGRLEISVRDLVVIVATGVMAATVAAFVPSRAAARIPVMTALGGRRPLGQVPRRLVPIGLALFGGGLALLVVAALGMQTASIQRQSSGAFVITAIVGGLGVLFGACCMGPVMVGLLARVGGRLHGGGRLAARSLARLRTRSSAVITAIAAAGAVAVGLSAALLGAGRGATIGFAQGVSYEDLPRNAVALTSQYISPTDRAEVAANATEYDPPRPAFAPTTLESRRAVDGVIAGVTWTPRLTAVFDPAPQPINQTSSTVDPNSFTESSGAIAIATDAQLNLLGLSARDRSTLETVGMLDPFAARANIGQQPGWIGDPQPGSVVHMTIDVTDAPVTLDVPVAHDYPTTQGNVYSSLIITEQTARDLGLEIVESGLIGFAPRDLTASQRNALNRRMNDVDQVDPFSDQPQIQTGLSMQYTSERKPWLLIHTAIVGGALLLILLVVAISLALSAAESRDERDVLNALGAKPATMKRVAGWKAGLVTLAGCLLAIPTGFLPMAAVTLANNSNDQVAQDAVVFPWVTVGLLVVVIPLIAGLVGWFGSGIAQRLRPTHMSTLITD